MAKTKNEQTTAPPPGFKSLEFKVWEPAIGDILEGTYLKRQDVRNVLGNDSEKDSFIGHHIRTADGLFTVSGAMLDTMLADVSFGSPIWIQFLGTEKKPNGRVMKKFSAFSKEA